MILPVIFFLFYGSLCVSSEVQEGDSCIVSDGSPGFCAFQTNCEIVFQQLKAGIEPKTICGNVNYEPLVCCPINTPAPTPAPARPSTGNRVGDGRGAISRQKCAEYAQSVYYEKPTIPVPGHKNSVNVAQCAISNQPVIVGGVKAKRMEFPHMAAVGFNGHDGNIVWDCGGSLISEIHVLTAAHCTHSREYGDAVQVRVGDLDLIRTDDGASPIDRHITERINHPEYRSPSRHHDIALLRLESRVPFNKWIRPACLHTAPSTGTERAIATGWGKLEYGGETGSDHLMKVELSFVDSTTCHMRWASAGESYSLPNGLNAEWSICAGEQDKDTCQGDSGGPLVILSDKKYYCMYDVIGVTSLGKSCGSSFPSVYTRVYHYVPWIESEVWPHQG